MRINTIAKSILLGSTMLCLATPAFAQADTAPQAAADEDGNNIVVTARRVEEKLQDVPISITVLSAAKLANNNITSAKDIATYTPGLTTNNRFGSDNTTWTVRGFTQEQRTTATVGTYFADVVAPRGSGATQGGDGAGPGNLFDLSNVQVLKGPQGTLQGRNSTGGAVLLVPKKPTDKLEGYLEGSIGNYRMNRVTAVLNLPLANSLRARFGVDHQRRDGYLQNAGKIGFGPYGDAGGSVDYWGVRGSIVWDVTPDIENYTVATYSQSKSTGVIPKITQAFFRDPYTGLTGTSAGNAFETAGTAVSGIITSNGGLALNQIANENAVCNGNFWCVSNSTYDSRSESHTWQAINTTTFRASDSLTIKNIASYGRFIGDTTLDLFGLYNPRGGAPGFNGNGSANLDAVAGPLFVRNFAATRSPPGIHTNAESSFVEELQFQWKGDKFSWQGGLYFENSDPHGKSGTGAPSQTPCGPIGSTVPAGDTAVQIDAQTICLATANQANSLGRVGLSLTENYFRGRAVYWQGIYELSNQLKVTAGIRYTWDTMRSNFQLINLRYYTSADQVVTNNGFGTITNILQTGFNGRNLLVPSLVNAGFGQGAGFCNNNVTFGYPANTPARGNNAYDPGSATNAYFPAGDAYNRCKESHTVKTSAPTWLLGLDYKPTDDLLLYGKYSRGYRQGGVASFGLDQVQDYDKEKVDTFEIGAKASWQGSMPGYFNIAAFHNNFTNQQLQIGIQCNPTANCPQTTAILNVGKSRLQGLEIEAGISPFEGFRLEASYAYLNTKIIALTDPTSYILARNSTLLGLDLRPLPIGSVIPNAQPHKLVLSASYRLPLDESVGKITFGATWVYSSAYRAVADPGVLAPGSCVNLGAPISGAPATGPLNTRFAPATFATNTNTLACEAAKPDAYASSYGVLPSSKVLNLNINWENVAGLPVDAAFFMTNVTKQRTYLHANVQTSNTGGFLSNIIGEPRMFGVRVKVKFGS